MVSEARAVRQLNEPEWRFAISQAHFSSGGVIEPDERATPEPLPARHNLVSAKLQFLSPLLSQLDRLRNESETDEYGTLRACQHAYSSACVLLVDMAITLAQKFGRQVPYGCVSTDSEGGVRIVWMRPTKSVQLSIPAVANGQDYLYHEDGDQFATEPLTTEALARRLNELGE